LRYVNKIFISAFNKLSVKNVFQREANTLQFIENYHNGLGDREECRENRDKCNGGEGRGRNQGLEIRNWESGKQELGIGNWGLGIGNQEWESAIRN
jgi:hypothetical protein